MSLPRKKCNTDGCENPVWSKGMCKNHVPRKEITVYGNLETIKKWNTLVENVVHDSLGQGVFYQNREQPSLSRKPLRKTRLKSKKYDPSTPQSIFKKEQTKARYELFHEIWLERGAKSEVSGTRLYGEPSSAHFHHILPKGKYPSGDLDPENIIIMTMDEHANVESDIYRYDEVNRRRELLKIKYKI